MSARPWLFVLLVLLAGCSVAARPAAMVPDTVAAARPAGARPSVALDVTGTEGDEIVNATLIRTRDFQQALGDALVRSGLFTIATNGTPDYRLRVEAKASAPAAGFNMTARVGGGWKLQDARTGRVLMDDFLTGSHRATVGDAFVGTTRVRLALEGAARDFIRQGLERLGRVELDGARQDRPADTTQ
jgi:hypothetical protein